MGAPRSIPLVPAGSRPLCSPFRFAALGLALLTVFAVACGSPAASPASSSQPASADPGSSGDPDSLHVAADALSRITQSDLEDLEAAAIDAAATKSGLLADLGETTWAAMLDLMRTAAHEAAAEAGSTARQGGAIVLAAAVAPRSPAGMSQVGGGGGVSIALAYGAATVALDGESGSGTGSAPFQSDPQEIVEDGRRTVGRVSGSVTFITEGSRVRATVDLQVATETFDVATGDRLGSGTFRTTGGVELDFCPDGSGTVRGRAALTVEGRGSGGSVTSTAEGEITATVGEDAFLQSAEASMAASDTSTPPGGTPETTSVDAEGAYAMGPDGSLDGMTTTRDVGHYTDSAGAGQATIDAIGERAGSMAGAVLALIATKAQARWRGGACVEIRSTESGRDVEPNELVQFTASLFHRIEGIELNKPILTTFAGKESVDPVDIAVPAPVLLSFRASQQEGDVGSIHLKSTSNRGIAELDVEFRVKRGGWMIEGSRNGAHLSGQKCGEPAGEWIVDGTYDQAGLQGTQRWTITVDASETSGTFTYDDHAEGKPGGAPVTVYVDARASGKLTLAIDDSGRALMHLTEETHESRSYTELGGAGWSSTTVGSYDLTWEVGGAC